MQKDRSHLNISELDWKRFSVAQINFRTFPLSVELVLPSSKNRKNSQKVISLFFTLLLISSLSNWVVIDVWKPIREIFHGFPFSFALSFFFLPTKNLFIGKFVGSWLSMQSLRAWEEQTFFWCEIENEGGPCCRYVW